MKLPFYIARKYLFSRHWHNIINFISGVAIVGVLVITMAMITVLSAFNGLESIVVGLFNSFNPDLEISPVKGKVFSIADFPLDKVQKDPNVKACTEVLEENALLRFNDQQDIVSIKGVSESYTQVAGVDTMVWDGSFILEAEGSPFAVFGNGVANKLNVSITDFLNPVMVYVPRRTASMSGFSAASAFNSSPVFPSGVFSIQQDLDDKYVFLPIGFVRELLEYDDEVSSIEIKARNVEDIDNLKERLQLIVGNGFIVQDRFEQEALLYKVLRSEKWAIVLILSFILVIATFNIISSLSMLILDKKKDIAVLQSMGAGIPLIKRIFLLEGFLITTIGIILGLFLGLALCVIQMKFGLIKLANADSFVVSAYPVEIHGIDFLYVSIIVFFIGIMASWFPVRRISGRYTDRNLLV